ncbi:MAG: N-acyl-D-glucosamine 2-epimerase [Chitinophagaceae bacterium]|nr:MAG: N-acyl-D-glucosamine 2-epimerase [Chitinophagaceae bacterium]
MNDTSILRKYSAEVETELNNILNFWAARMPDQKHNGFIGRIGGDNQAYPEAAKGVVLNSRILWTFSAAYLYNKNSTHLDLADRAYDYITRYFIDSKYGGVYWMLNFEGKATDETKQIYAQAFALYALAEYCKTDTKAEVLAAALRLYELIESKSFDEKYGGYIDAFTRDWQPVGDSRLSAKDAASKKTMNTHLHLVEAYANLYLVWPDAKLKSKIIHLLGNFTGHIIDHKTQHMGLYYNEQWKRSDNIISYGHDIEAAWLLLEAAEIIKDEPLISTFKKVSTALADSVLPGIADDGGLWYEKEGDHTNREKHWWPQAEAMVGYLNAYELSKDERYLHKSINTWQFVKKNLLDKSGEWYWGIDQNGKPMIAQDKAGPWKCPYHNGRACLEIIKRVRKITETK